MKADRMQIKGAPHAQEKLALGAKEGGSRIQSRDGGRRVGDISCEPELWVSFFFDGTDNNKDVDDRLQKHTNIARLFQAHLRPDPVRNIYPEYVSGVGTAFTDDLTGKVLDKGGTFGKAVGAGGYARLNCAMVHLKARIKAAESQSPTQKIRQIHVAIFGFSRGAALARAFALMLEKETYPYTVNEVGNPVFNREGPPVWKGAHPHPFRIYFMGLFDTVASVGTPTSLRSKKLSAFILGGVLGVWSAATADGHGAWASDLRIPSSRLVERCLHLVAAHELRLSFPADLVVNDGYLPSNCREILYPGVHSDVGGGYLPGEDGRGDPNNPDNDSLKLSQIPLHHMFREAWAAGVPLRHPALSDTKKGWGPVQEKDFALDPGLVQLFNAYLDSLQPLTPDCQSTLQAWIEAHMGSYYRWRATVLDQDPPVDRSEKKAPKKQAFLQGVHTHNVRFKEDCQRVCKEGDFASPYQRLLADAWHIYKDPHPKASVLNTENPDVRRFFQEFVHDSVSDFWRDAVLGSGTTPTDDSRLSFPRVFYQGGDDQAQIAQNDAAQSREVTAVG